MTTHAAEFCTLDEVNRLKIIQDIVDRHLITQMAAHRLGITDDLSADVFRRIIPNLARLVWLTVVVKNPAIFICNKKCGAGCLSVSRRQPTDDSQSAKMIQTGNAPPHRGIHHIYKLTL